MDARAGRNSGGSHYSTRLWPWVCSLHFSLFFGNTHSVLRRRGATLTWHGTERRLDCRAFLLGTSNDTYSPFGRMEWLYLGSSDSLSLRSDLLSSQHHHLGVLRQRFEYIQQQVWAFAQIYRLISTKVNQHLIISEERYIAKCGLLFFSKKWYILGRNWKREKTDKRVWGNTFSCVKIVGDIRFCRNPCAPYLKIFNSSKLPFFWCIFA